VLVVAAIALSSYGKNKYASLRQRSGYSVSVLVHPLSGEKRTNAAVFALQDGMRNREKKSRPGQV